VLKLIERRQRMDIWVTYGGMVGGCSSHVLLYTIAFGAAMNADLCTSIAVLAHQLSCCCAMTVLCATDHSAMHITLQHAFGHLATCDDGHCMVCHMLKQGTCCGCRWWSC
jgi:hypothetical protein